MKRLAVLTSGGDAPGMNAAVRSVVRCAIAAGYEVSGVVHGYTGLIAGTLRPLGLRDVGGVIHTGGTMLGTTRCMELKTPQGLDKAFATLRRAQIDALVVIGGNGSQTGAAALSAGGARVIGVPSTIDNDLYGCDVSIGATTAVDVALEAIDRLRTTASSMQRAFLVELMGRQCGYIALMAGIAGGAEVVTIPEADSDPGRVIDELQAALQRGKSHAIAVIAEGSRHDASAILAYLKQRRPDSGLDLRVTTLGHVQRGGAPGSFDRMLATVLGSGAVDAALAGRFGVLVGMESGAIAMTPLSEIAGKTRPADARLLSLARTLAL